REIYPVGRVGPSLRFEADRVRLPVQPSAFSADRAIEIVSRINLQAGLVGQEFEHSPGAWRFEPRRQAQRARAIQAEIVIVSFAMPQLLIVSADPCTDRSGGAEIERRTRDGARRFGQGN